MSFLSGLSLSVIIAGVIMAAAFVGMIICARKQQTTEAAKPIAVGLMVLVLICALVILKGTGIFGDPSAKVFIQNEMVYNRVAGYILGKYLSEKFPQAKVLLVVDKIPGQEIYNQQISGLKEGFGGKLNIVAEDMPLPPVEPTATETDPGTGEVAQSADAPAPAPATPSEWAPASEMMSLRETMKASDFDAMLQKHKDCNLVITMIGLPMNVHEMTFWTEEETPENPKAKIAVMNGDVYRLMGAIQNNLVCAAVTYSPNAVFDERTPPSEMQKAFDKRYLLVTPDNIEQINTTFPGLFEKHE